MMADAAAAIMLLNSNKSLLFEELQTTEDEDNDMLLFINGSVRKSSSVIQHTRIACYVELTCKQYSPDEFKSHFRLSRSTAEALMMTMEKAMSGLPASRRPRVSAEKVTLMSIWQMSNQESYRDIADRFDLSAGHAHRCFSFFVKTLCNKVGEYIMWPLGNKGLQSLHDFSNLREIPFPGAFAAVDGCHICIPSPRDDRASYYNRKGFHSILLQGICDSQKRFINIFVGWPGSSHDARVWKNSPIYKFLSTHTEEYLPSNSHILGDTAYPCDTFLMCPYKDNGHLTRCQKRFNAILSSSRVVIEQAFGMLKGRFRRLKYLDMSDLRLAAKVVSVACILHNLCLENDDDEYFDSFINEDLLCNSESESHSRLGHAKRDTISATLFT